MMNRRLELPAFFAPVVLAYVVAAFCLAGVSWDGAGYLFNSLQEGRPVISHHRYSNLPTLAAIVGISGWTDNAQALAVVYGLLVALTPIGSLILSFHYLREEALQPLRIWPALGILWGALPGEICLMSEASLAVQVFWVILAFIAARCPAKKSGWMLPVVAYLFFSHPTSALLFGIAALLCLGLARNTGRRGIIWCVLFASLAAGRFWFAIATATPYERGEFSLENNWQAFLGGVWGWQLGLLLFLYLFSATLFLQISSGLPKTKASGIFAGAFLAVGVWWAADPVFWVGAISYRRFVLLAALPLVLCATVHWILLARRRRPSSPPRWLLPAVGVIFAAIYIVQCAVWRADVARLESDLAAASGSFLVRPKWMKNHAIDHWGTSMLSAIVQGRRPHVLYAESPDHIRDDHLELFPGGQISLTDGWFELSPLRE